jgi:hypothetical protein
LWLTLGLTIILKAGGGQGYRVFENSPAFGQPLRPLTYEEAGATLIKGSAGLVLKNSSGVVLNLKSEQKGAALSLGNQGLSISPASE